MKIAMIIIIACMFLSGFILMPYLPAMIPMHWNVMGEVDSYWSKTSAVWFIPLLTLAMFVLFRVLPNFDPKKDKYKLFQKEWQIMQFGLVAFMAYVQFMILYLTFHPDVHMMPLMFIGLGALFVLIGNYLSKIRQNYFIGLKLPWTLASEDNWNKTHRFASWCFVIAGILTLAEAFFIWYAPGVIFTSILLAVILPMVYSFLLYKKAVKKMKFVFLGFIVLILALAVLRGLSGEDDWICERSPASASGSGEARWVRHGNPSAPMPVKACK